MVINAIVVYLDNPFRFAFVSIQYTRLHLLLLRTISSGLEYLSQQLVRAGAPSCEVVRVGGTLLYLALYTFYEHNLCSFTLLTWQIYC